MPETRTSYVKKNILWANVSNVVLTLVSFVCRTVFIYILGAEYLGISGLFTNVLGLLSFSELGIGTAINFSLYKPIADNDREKIKSLMQLYKKAYQGISIIVAVFGLILLPFLQYLVNSDIPLHNIRLFYLIFLFNTVSSYFVSYKTSFVSAIQKDYVVTNLNTIGQITIYIIQIIGMIVFPFYIVYLLIQAIVGVIQKVLTVVYINKKYPILTEKNINPLDKNTKKDIFKNVKALIIHKVGDVAVHQTDNIIISVFLNTLTVGLMSNYTTLNTMIEKFTNSIFNGFTASIGNLIAKETKDKQEEIFDVYDFLGFWIYGFVFIAFVTLSQPFITLWIGKKMLIDNITIWLYFFTIYLAGQSLTVYNFKSAAGKFNEDKWVAFVQAIVNLVVSIVAVKIIGLPGVYIGTLVQRLIVNIVRPRIVYKYVLERKSSKYFLRFIFRTILMFLIAILLYFINRFCFDNVTVLTFILLTIITCIVPNIIFIVIFRKTKEFKFLLKKIKR